MSFFSKRADRHPHAANPQPHPAEDHRRPTGQVEDEMGLFGLGFDRRDDRLDRHTLTSKPEDYYSCNPRQVHHEVL